LDVINFDNGVSLFHHKEEEIEWYSLYNSNGALLQKYEKIKYNSNDRAPYI
jgi:hypothetical protein